LSRLQGHNAPGRIRSIEKSDDLIGNRTRDIQARSIVPQLTTLPRAAVSPSTNCIGDYIVDQHGRKEYEFSTSNFAMYDTVDGRKERL
jgi:hypothetical protein